MYKVSFGGKGIEEEELKSPWRKKTEKNSNGGISHGLGERRKWRGSWTEGKVGRLGCRWRINNITNWIPNLKVTLTSIIDTQSFYELHNACHIAMQIPQLRTSFPHTSPPKCRGFLSAQCKPSSCCCTYFLQLVLTLQWPPCTSIGTHHYCCRHQMTVWNSIYHYRWLCLHKKQATCRESTPWNWPPLYPSH